MGSETMIEYENVYKYFGGVCGLRNLTVSIPKGRVIGLVGANGAGKSTMLRTAMGLYLPTDGQCKTLGVDVSQLGPEELAQIGYVHQRGKLLDWMTVRNYLEFIKSYYDTWNKDFEREFLKQFDIPLGRRVGKLSPGIYQQLAVLSATAFDAPLLVFDEPVSDLDPLARAKFFDMLIEMISKKDRTIVMSSHILSDIEKVIDYLIVLDQGELVIASDFDTLREQFVMARFTAENLTESQIREFGGVVSFDLSADEALVIFKDKTKSSIMQFAEISQMQVELSRLNLEDIYKLLVA